ncbi:MAG: hypothetical protein A2V72_01945 [Candidatus Nealsonbacteria bacterium RBG_13_37_56]|uniref:Transcriptional regulator n=1 Tax=Candidatus Nealsonbacteria bacterium RBG_13_37_56 TaxID=1801661 RepID=A0A1G2DWM8_9BACT|nr:MAG: hypothetical protein A2V72_01945 [Candidatus Nealsonbacteria bacterium RBG_13_37_56]
MKFLDLKRQHMTIKKEIDQAINRVLDSNVYIGGPEVQGFEKEVADFLKIKYGVGVNSGTDALKLSLQSLGIKRGDEVITSPFTFIASAEVIVDLGAKPVFADINPRTFNIDPLKIEEKITSKTRAIIPIHIFGQLADMNSIVKIAREHNLFIIEDAAQSLGVKGMGRGDLTCLSFFPSKNLGAYGDGGMIMLNNEKIKDKLLLLRNHGSSLKEKYLNLVLGTNSRLDAIQAAILRVKLKYLNQWNKKRKEKAEYYNSKLGGIVEVPFVEKDHVFNQYTIKTRKRNQLKNYLDKNGIPSMIYYPLPLHRQPVFKDMNYSDYPEADQASKQVLSLPIYPELEQEEQDDVIKKIKSFYE